MENTDRDYSSQVIRKNEQRHAAFKAILIIIIAGILSFAVFIGAVTWGLKHLFSGGSSGSSGRVTLSASSKSSKGPKLGVIELFGVIMDSKRVLEDLDAFEDEDEIKGVILHINSPGGAVAPSQEIFEAVKKLNAKKPVFASMSTVAASGGYYVACGAKRIFASPGTITGSIGVIMQFVDLSRLYEWAKFKPYNVKTGRFKDIGNPERVMDSEERALVQGMIDNVLEQFRSAVQESRHLTREQVVALSDGRIFSGAQAKEAGLVDELGGLRDTAQKLVAETKESGRPVLVYPAEKSRFPWQQILFSGDDDAEESRSAIRGITQLLRLMGVVGQNDGSPKLSSKGGIWAYMTAPSAQYIYGH